MALIDTKRGKIRIPDKPAERVQKWMEKQKKAGGRAVTIFLDPEALECLDALLDIYPAMKKKEVVSLAIRRLYDEAKKKPNQK